jgi:spermidine synthase
MELWYTEEHTSDIRFSIKVKETLFHGESEYQKIDILDTHAFGRVLLLDGLVMTTEKDEFVYHESISHIPLSVHPDPKHVLIIGGGDGGTLREVVKHEAVDKVTLVDIDEQVMELSRIYLPFLAAGWEHPKAEVRAMNGFDFLQDKQDSFDVILVDSTDPIGPGEVLFQDRFYDLVHKALRRDGIMVQQVESFWVHPEVIGGIAQTLRGFFQRVDFFTAPIPTYPAGYWNFSFCQKNGQSAPPQLLDQERLAALPPLRYLNPEIARAVFALPNFARKALE